MSFLKFNDIDISTRTIIVVTGLELHIEQLFNEIPITKYIIQEKKRGRKRKDHVVAKTNIELNKGIKDGSIITMKYEDKIKGVEFKRKKKSTFFRNAITIVMVIKDKLINLKISKNGKFQITGCKSIDNCKEAVLFLLNIIINTPIFFKPPPTNTLNIIFNIVMTNKDFSLGFLINREKFDNILNHNTPYNSLLETSFGYTGINLKMKLYPDDIHRSFNCIKYDINSKEYSSYEIDYDTYIKSLSKINHKKEMKNDRYITFLIFQSGNIIMSGINEYIMEKYYNIFIDIVKKNLTDIKEVIRSN